MPFHHAARRKRASKAEDAANAVPVRTLEFEQQARSNLGLPEVESELADLYGVANRPDRQFAFNRLNPIRGESDEKRADATSQIRSRNAQVRADAGLAPTATARTLVDAFRLTGGAGAKLARRNAESEAESILSSTPGLGTALSTLQRDQDAAQQNLVSSRLRLTDREQGAIGSNRGGPRVTSGGQAANEAAQPSLERVLGLLGVEKLDNRTASRNSGRSGVAIGTALGRIRGTRDANLDIERFREAIGAERKGAQRQVRALNQSVFSGRRRRSGSQRQLPKIALAGLARLRGQ